MSEESRINLVGDNPLSEGEVSVDGSETTYTGTTDFDIEADEFSGTVQTEGSYDGPAVVDRDKLKESIDQFNAEITSGSSEERWQGDFDLPARLTKDQVVMELNGLGSDEVHFITSTELDRERSYRMPREMFEELGRPRLITVTVRPGDHLN